MANKNNINKNSNFVDKTMAIFLMLAVAIIPLIVRIRIVPVGKYEYGIIRASSAINDMFSYNKAVAICILALVMALYLVAGIVLEEKRLKLKLKALPSYIMYSYVGLCLLSAICSKYTSIAFWGISERYEGFFVLLSYAVFFIMAMSFTSNEETVKCMLGIFSLSVLFVGIVGTLQTIGFDFYATTTGSKLVLGQYYGGENLSMKFDAAYATLYNPNCLGMYAGMMSAFMLIPTVMIPVKNKFKYMFAFLFVLSVVCMLGSNSVGGLLGFAVACVFAFVIGTIMFIKNKLYKNKLYLASAIILLAAIIILPAVLMSTNADIVKKVDVITSALNSKGEDNNPNFYEDINFDGDTATIVTKAGLINIIASDSEPVIVQNGTVRDIIASLPMEGEENGHVNSYLIDGLQKGEVQVYDDKLVFIGYDNSGNRTNFLMRKTEDGIKPLDKFGSDVDIDTAVPSIGFEGIERLGSARGYIWSRSIPLVFKNIVIGKGPDSFALEFPQNDIVSKLKYLGNPYIIVDKPHNIYLQSAINTGVLSLIAILALVIIYLVQTILKLVKEKNSGIINMARLACSAGVVAYMAAGFTTDSVVSVAPVFWIMLGMGYGVNMIKAVGEKNGSV